MPRMNKRKAVPRCNTGACAAPRLLLRVLAQLPELRFRASNV